MNEVGLCMTYIDDQHTANFEDHLFEHNQQLNTFFSIFV